MLKNGQQYLAGSQYFLALFCRRQGQNIVTDISIAKRAIFIKKGMFLKIKIIKVD